MTNSYYLANDVERRRSQLQAEAAARLRRTHAPWRFRDLVQVMTGTESRKPQLLFPRPAPRRCASVAWTSATMPSAP